MKPRPLPMWALPHVLVLVLLIGGDIYFAFTDTRLLEFDWFLAIAIPVLILTCGMLYLTRFENPTQLTWDERGLVFELFAKPYRLRWQRLKSYRIGPKATFLHLEGTSRRWGFTYRKRCKIRLATTAYPPEKLHAFHDYLRAHFPDREDGDPRPQPSLTPHPAT